jgi:hypothetical protein
VLSDDARKTKQGRVAGPRDSSGKPSLSANAIAASMDVRQGDLCVGRRDYAAEWLRWADLNGPKHVLTTTRGRRLRVPVADDRHTRPGGLRDRRPPAAGTKRQARALNAGHRMPGLPHQRQPTYPPLGGDVPASGSLYAWSGRGGPRWVTVRRPWSAVARRWFVIASRRRTMRLGGRRRSSRNWCCRPSNQSPDSAVAPVAFCAA